jgi:hypothetical protein
LAISLPSRGHGHRKLCRRVVNCVPGRRPRGRLTLDIGQGEVLRQVWHRCARSAERLHEARRERELRDYSCVCRTLRSTPRTRVRKRDNETNRRRDAIYGYLEAVYDLVNWWSAEGCEVDRARQAMRLRGLLLLPREDVFAAVIRCTADPARADKRTRSKWSRVLRYVKMQKDEKEPFAGFIKRKGGVNECNARYGRCLKRLAARRRSIGEFQWRSASKRKGVIRRLRT